MQTRRTRDGAFIGLALAACVAIGGGPALAFEPARQFPDTWSRIAVYVDQLPNLSTAQAQFAATHYAGTQKQLSSQINFIRQFNPDFLHLQYRLGYRVSAPVFIHNDMWTNDFSSIDPNETWFVHDSQNNRVKHVFAGVDEFIMDVDNTAFQNYYINTVSSDVTASGADGWFADSTHLPTNVPSDLWDSPLGSQPHTAFIDEMERWYDYVYAEMDSRNQYFIPNIGNLVTTADTTTGYYQDVHGAMVEGFGITVFGAADWRLQMNRTLSLINNDKIFIAQNGIGDDNDTAARMWLLSNYLLVKRERSYLNIIPATGGVSAQLHWWPEYDIDLGAPADDAKFTSITDLDLDADGVYRRDFENGFVLVNGTASQKTVAVDPAALLVTASGGGLIGSDGAWITPGTLDYSSVGNMITLEGFSGAVFVYTVPEPATLTLLTVGIVALATCGIRRRRSLCR